MNTAKVVFESLKRVQMFSSLSVEELDSLMGKISIRRFRRNEIILREDDANDYMYIVLNGSVKVVQADKNGRELILAIHKTGNSFGELSLIDSMTSPATVMSMERTTVAIISKNNFYLILYSQRKVLDNVLFMLCQKLRESWSMVQMINHRNASRRVALLLDRLGNEHGEIVPEGKLLNIRLTHRNIADMSGLTRESVSRVMDRFTKDGHILIRTDKKICLSHNFSEGSAADDSSEL